MRVSSLIALALCIAANPLAAQDAPATPGGQRALDILEEAIAVPTVRGAPDRFRCWRRS